MSDVVKADQAGKGSRGEQLHARGEQVGLRVWQHEPAGETAPEHSNSYEYVAYLVAGAMRVRIGEGEAQELGAGDSYVVPAQTPYAFEVLESATVVEAVAPPSALDG